MAALTLSAHAVVISVSGTDIFTQATLKRRQGRWDDRTGIPPDSIQTRNDWAFFWTPNQG